VRAEQVIAAGLLDVKEIVLRRHFTKRQNIDAVRRVHKQVAEVADPIA